LLDLFCGAGGAAVGYHRAGFEVVGVDIVAQPHYPFEFHQGDALAAVRSRRWEWDNSNFDAIHASPPCQAFTQMSAKWRGKGGKADSHPDLLTPTRELLPKTGLPYVIENVVGARRMMEPTLVLHGGLFGLGVNRPRLFECNFVVLMAPGKRTPQPLGVYGDKPDGRRLWGESKARDRYHNNGNYKGKSLIRAAKSIEEAREAMGIDWMDWDEIKEAIPPAYTEFIGRQLIDRLAVKS
jgi:DNA (cytosine-5)-methyltransferase 1